MHCHVPVLPVKQNVPTVYLKSLFLILLKKAGEMGKEHGENQIRSERGKDDRAKRDV